MKKLNKKGFVLVETLIVTVFVVTLFIVIYQTSIPAMGEYMQLNKYDDIDSVYYNNLYKQMLTRYGDLTYVDNYLTTHTYLDISDCSNSNIYKTSEYCNLIKNAIGMNNTDRVFVTNYNIASFKATVRSDEYFDSGTLSNFRDYINTVTNTEPFYNKVKDTALSGKYRIFLVRNVLTTEGKTSRRYSNIGVYSGGFEKYMAGDLVKYNPGDGEKNFYVLKNSQTTEGTVTLILASNINTTGVCFNSTKTSSIPDTALDALRNVTDGWLNVGYLSNYQYTASAGYTIDYSNYRARLLDDYDIMELLGCKEDGSTCFNRNEAFAIDINDEKIAFLYKNLSNTNGYWTAVALPNSDLYAWSVTNKKITPTNLNDCTNFGIRPVITVDKRLVKRG